MKQVIKMRMTDQDAKVFAIKNISKRLHFKIADFQSERKLRSVDMYRIDVKNWSINVTACEIFIHRFMTKDFTHTFYLKDKAWVHKDNDKVQIKKGEIK